MSRPPNILFFFPDQQRHDWTGLNRQLPLRAPNTNALAARGTNFTRAWCSSPLCAPSRACVASGRRYDRCGVADNGANYPLDQPTYFQGLRDTGYRVAGVGKFDLHKNVTDPENRWWELDGSRLLPEWGFTEGIDNEGKFDGSGSYRIHGEPRGPYLAFLEQRGFAEVYLQEHAELKQHMGAYTTTLPDDAYCDNWVADNGLRFLRGFPQDTPWHLVVNFTGPHNPMDVTASMRARWEHEAFEAPHDNDESDREGLLRNRQNYAAMIENIDAQVGRFVQAVEARGELENTIVIYASDHGEMLGDHGRWGKSTWHQPSVGVPLVIAGPEVAEGATCAAPVVLHDLPVWLLERAGSRPLPDADGRSLQPLLSDASADHREVVVSGLDDWRAATDGHHKLVVQKGQEDRLFDLDADPWEDANLAQDAPPVGALLRRALVEEAGESWAG
ncbi:MAG TPA: sulfatase-like hydrolase/transferase [Candidatus Latescibacteria bacterium]|jgi:choline-sulfatase|nr:choline-sulfatase [Gemmatimonadaceae bacterium]HJP33811.1 sulfatase-like hydrolase/transferase [Candidatus Latescibacterota bacterium]